MYSTAARARLHNLQVPTLSLSGGISFWGRDRFMVNGYLYGFYYHPLELSTTDVWNAVNTIGANKSSVWN
jgi:hypothetical protein